MVEGKGQAMEITGDLDRYMAEILRLEIRQLARRFGLDIGEYRIETASKDSGQPE
jgi:hypothetical protein